MRLRPETDPLVRTLLAGSLPLAALGLLLIRWQPAVLRLLLPDRGCPLRRAVEVPCPTCGGTRAILALAAGRLRAAWQASPLVTVAGGGFAALALVALVATVFPTWRRQVSLSGRERRALGWLLVAIVAAGWVYEIVCNPA